jgi:hypothetical protein
MSESTPALLLLLVLGILVLPGTLYLLLLSLAALRKATLPVGLLPAPGKLAIIVPAHNESAGIARTVGQPARYRPSGWGCRRLCHCRQLQ